LIFQNPSKTTSLGP